MRIYDHRSPKDNTSETSNQSYEKTSEGSSPRKGIVTAHHIVSAKASSADTAIDVGYVFEGDRVEIIGMENGYYKIRSGDFGEGFVYSKFIKEV